MFTVIWKENREYKSEDFYSKEKAEQLGRMIQEAGDGPAIIRKN